MDHVGRRGVPLDVRSEYTERRGAGTQTLEKMIDVSNKCPYLEANVTIMGEVGWWGVDILADTAKLQVKVPHLSNG